MRPAMTDTAPDTAMPAEIASLVERLRERAESYRMGGPSSEHTAALLDEAATALTTERSAHAEARKALDALDRMSRGVDWCDQDEQARRWSAARRALGKGERDAG